MANILKTEKSMQHCTAFFLYSKQYLYIHNFETEITACWSCDSRYLLLGNNHYYEIYNDQYQKGP